MGLRPGWLCAWMQRPRGLRGRTPEPGPQGGGHVRAVPALPHAAAENQVRGRAVCAPEPLGAETDPGLTVSSLDESGLALPANSSRVCVSSGHSFRAWLPLHFSMKLILCLLFTESPGVGLRSPRGCWRLHRWLRCWELPLTPTPSPPQNRCLFSARSLQARTQRSCPKTAATLADGVDATSPSGFSQKRLCDLSVSVKPGWCGVDRATHDVPLSQAAPHVRWTGAQARASC